MRCSSGARNPVTVMAGRNVGSAQWPRPRESRLRGNSHRIPAWLRAAPGDSRRRERGAEAGAAEAASAIAVRARRRLASLVIFRQGPAIFVATVFFWATAWVKAFWVTVAIGVARGSEPPPARHCPGRGVRELIELMVLRS